MALAGPPGLPAEPPVYRPFALLAFATTLLVATPIGIVLLTRLHLTGGPVGPAWPLLHAHLQLFGFFAVLILGMAPHLLARFTGRPLVRARVGPWLFGLMGTAAGLRVAGVVAGHPSGLLLASLLEVAAFTLFTERVRRTLRPPALALTRGHLVAASGWLVAALLLEAVLRLAALAAGDADPDPRVMRVVHLAGTFGGVIGWILGVVLRAGPMFVPRWRVRSGLARLAPAGLALGVVVGAAGEALGGGGVGLARLGEAVALGTVAAVILSGGAARGSRRGLPLMDHRGPDTALFRLSLAAAVLAAIGSAGVAALAMAGMTLSLVADALRHLMTIGFLGAMVLAMSFRLLPAIERRPLPWPRLRGVALWALSAAVALRTVAIFADYGWIGVLRWLPLSGVLAWVAFACGAANLVSLARARPG